MRLPLRGVADQCAVVRPALSRVCSRRRPSQAMHGTAIELPIGTKVRLEGHCLKQKARLTQMRGLLIREDTNEVVAEAEASFMLSVDSYTNR